MQKQQKNQTSILFGKQTVHQPIDSQNMLQLFQSIQEDDKKKVETTLVKASKVLFYGVFEMAAMPFPCNGILVFLSNLPTIFPMSSLIYASFYIPYFNL